MAAISTSQYNSGQVIARAVTGGVNLQASHTMMVRLKNSSTATNITTVVMSYLETNPTFSDSGSAVGRNSGFGTSSQQGWYRINDSFSPTADNAAYGTCYGNTTTWYHLAFVYNASTQRIRAYIDGTYIGQHTSNTSRTQSVTSNTYGCCAHPGKFADFAFFNRALTDQEVSDMADYRVPQVTSGLLAFWRLDSDATDSSGNGANGTVSGGTPNITWSTADNPPQPETPTVAIAGTAASTSTFTGSLTSIKPHAGTAASTSTFTGSLSVAKPLAGTAATTSALSGALSVAKPLAATVSSTSALSAWLRPRWGRRVISGSASLSRTATLFSASSPWTVMGWYKTFTVGTNRFQFATTGGAAIIRLGSNTSGQLQIEEVIGGAVNYTTADDNQWHHLAMSYDGTTLRAYVDASLQASGAVSLSGNFIQLLIDAQSSGVAELAHIKAFTFQLSAAEILSEATYYTPHTGSPAQLYAWWQMGWQNVTLDSSGNGRSLTDNSSAEAQTEAPGLPLADLAGAAASTSTFTGSLNTTKPIDGTAASTSTFTGALSQAQPLAGTAATTSQFSGDLGTLKPIAGTAQSISAFSGALIQSQPLASTAQSTSQFSGALDSAAPLAGTAGTTSAFQGDLGTLKPVAGTLGSTSQFSGTLGATGVFTGVAQTVSAFSGDLNVSRELAATLGSTSAFSGTLTQLHALSGTLATGSQFEGTTASLTAIAGEVATTSQFSAALTVEKPLAGVAQSVSSFSGALTNVVPLAGTAQSVSQFSGTLINLNALVGTAATSSSFSGTLSNLALRAIEGLAATVSHFSGSLTVTQQASARGDTETDGMATAFYGPSVVESPRSPRPWPPRY